MFQAKTQIFNHGYDVFGDNDKNLCMSMGPKPYPRVKLVSV